MISRRKSVAILEPDPEGHKMVYVHRIVREAVRQNLDCRVVTLQKGIEHPVYQAMEQELKGRFTTEIMIPDGLAEKLMYSSSQMLRQVGHYRLFRQYFRKPAISPVDHIFVPTLEHCDKIMLLLGSPFGDVCWSGLVMQNKFHYTAMGLRRPPKRTDKWMQAAYLRLLCAASLGKLFTIDEPLYQYTQRFYPRLASKLCYVPEPVQIQGDISRQEARKQFGLREDQFVVLVYGALSVRKGIAELLVAMQQPEIPVSVSLLLAGKQDQNVRDILAGETAQTLRTQERLTEADHFFYGEDEYSAFKAADVVWIGYRDFYGMSAVLIQAGAMGLPVIACQEGVVGWLTQRHQLGIVVDVAQPAEIQSALQRLTKDNDFYQEIGQKGKALALNHQERNFSEPIIQTISGEI